MLTGIGIFGVASGSVAAAEGFEPLGRLELRGVKELVVDGETAYAAVTDGFATVDVSNPSKPQLLAERRNLLSDHPEGPLELIQDGKLGGDYYALAGPAHPRSGVPYAAVVFDVSDPTAPERFLTYETEFYHHNIDTDGETLFLCGNDGGDNPLVCVDIDSGEELGRWSVVESDNRWSEVHHQLREFHDVWVEDGMAHCALWNAGTWLVDVSSPSNPRAVGSLRGLDPTEQADIVTTGGRRAARLGLPGNDHFCMPQRGVDSDLLAINEEAWGTEEDTPASDLGGVELRNGETGDRLARIEAPPTEDATFGGTWTTAHNLDFVGDRLYTSWYRGGVKVHDVSDPTAPRELAHWRNSETAEFWTAQRGPDCVVASSWRDPSHEDPVSGAAVYTFPEPEEATPPTDAEGAGFGSLAAISGVGAAALYRRYGTDSSGAEQPRL
jgi:hypothetical protein